MSETFFDVSAFSYAHRGLWDQAAPENSLAAFRAAAREGLGCELDVRVTADNKLVVFHDATLERMCGRPERVDALPQRLLRDIRLPDGSSIPTLEEALEAMDGMPALVEMKIDKSAGGSGIRTGLPALIGALNHSNAPAAVMSFDEPAMWKLGYAVLERPKGILIEPDQPGGEGAAVEKALRARGTDVTYLAPHHSMLSAVADLAGGRPVVTWTLRSPEQLQQARRYGAAPIFEGFSPALAKRPGTPI